jgi:phospholipid-binding lipoprotein MlaA
VTLRAWAALLAACLAAACATNPDADPRDPFEPANRAIYRFNDALDEAVMKPVATAYRDLLHEEIRSRVRNFFSNIADLFIGVNNILQGKFQEGIEDWARFAFNSTLGLFGIHDIASEAGIEKHNEDFGQTLGRWGAGPGPYLVLPILGSSTVRDGIGTGLDMYVDPVSEFRPIWTRNSAYALRITNTRADLLDASRILEQAALDKYVFQRDAYLQRRQNLIYDGRPPRENGERPGREEDEEKKPPAEEKKGSVNPGTPPHVTNFALPRSVSENQQ